MRIIRTIGLLVGLFGTLLSVVSVVLDWIGRRDTILAHEGPVIALLLNPPPFLIWLAIGAAGFVFVWSDFRWQHYLRTIPKVVFREVIERQKAYQLHGIQREFALKVENDSDAPIDNCLLKVEAITAHDTSKPFTQHLPRAIQTVRNVERDGGGPFNLRGHETKILSLCRRVDGKQSEMEFIYEGEIHPSWSYSLRDTKNFSITIGCYGAPKAAMINLRAQIDERGRLHLSEEAKKSRWRRA